MSYRGIGPYVWVPRRGIHGIIPGGFPLPTDAGVAKPTLGSTAKNYAPEVSAYAQGYVTKEVGEKARSTFRSTTGVDIPWVPTSDKQVGPWAKDMANIWGGPAMQLGIENGKQARKDSGGAGNPGG